ncbi:MAG: hypothetical protein IPP42_05355 [Saprospiraceae bacterium]|nr:hypothetical protein [Saprospiraceae bacterium]
MIGYHPDFILTPAVLNREGPARYLTSGIQLRLIISSCLLRRYRPAVKHGLEHGDSMAYKAIAQTLSPVGSRGMTRS